MIDFHSHILPKVDDGSGSIEESLELLKRLKEQGVTAVAATPHFLPDKESVSQFIERRNKAYEALTAQVEPGMPEIMLGAEVKYYEGISRLEDLKSLRLEGTKLLLLEMPMCKWHEFAIRELIDISCMSRITPVLAHIERYLPLQKKNVIYTLLESGILMQSNASFFTQLASKRNALKMVANGEIHFLGSDCHNLTSRPPKLDKAVDVITKKFGDGFACNMLNFAELVLAENRINKG